MLSESFLTNTKNYITNKFRKEGFLNTKVTLNTVPDSTDVNLYNMVVRVDRGNRVKIKDIVFNGNEVFKDKKLASKLKNTKKRAFYRFWKSSKYIADEFEEDKDGLLDFFKEKGYRDARIIRDTVIHDDNTLSLNLM